FTVVLQPHGTDAAGTATLDLCNGTYPSEKLRTARRQVIVADAQGNGVLSTEAVLYRSPAATAQAFTELRNVTAHCPSKPVASPVGEPTVQTKFFAAPDTTWPQTAGVERLAFDLDTVDASGQHFRSAAVYLRRGRVLLGIYFSPANGTATTVQHKTSTADIVGIFAARMADLPAHAING
ncbi:MAG TPA: hypothetical protein VN636_05090, partial [Acidimicrobiia bacterium]|nr:hypothetical protein [Acidimicrobiia bacterium]